MIQLGAEPEAQLLAFARSWCSLVAKGEWERARGMLDEPDHYGIEWTQQRVVALLDDTFGEGTAFAAEHGRPMFSDPAMADGTERYDFGRTRQGGFWFDYDVPLNGSFSDLTAQFEFHPRAAGFAAVLHELHVM